MGGLGGTLGLQIGALGALGEALGTLGRPRAILGAKGGGESEIWGCLGGAFGHILVLFGVKSSNAKMCTALRREHHFRGSGGSIWSSGVAFLGGREALRCMISCVLVQEPAEHEKWCLGGGAALGTFRCPFCVNGANVRMCTGPRPEHHFR